MRLLTYKREINGPENIGVMCRSSQKDFYPIKQFGLDYEDMTELIMNITPAQKELLENESATGNHVFLDYHEVVHCAPIPRPRQDIICLGLNFLAHVEESFRYKNIKPEEERTHAVYFSKRVTEAVGDGGYIPSHQNLVDSLDYEAELAVIIGRDAINVKAEEAFDYVFGYTIMNDISARNIQNRHKQWYFGKSMDGFTLMGPYIRTENEMKRPPVLSIKSRVNGQLRQNSTIDLLIFDIPHVIAELSSGMTLKAGTIISMGTPEGVGMGFHPPKFLKPGDVVECDIQDIGTLRNIVK